MTVQRPLVEVAATPALRSVEQRRVDIRDRQAVRQREIAFQLAGGRHGLLLDPLKEKALRFGGVGSGTVLCFEGIHEPDSRRSWRR